MPPRTERVVAAIASFAFGAPVAFFVGGSAFFADGPMNERYLGVAISAGVLFVMGLVGGAIVPAQARTVTVWLVAPLVPVALLLVPWRVPAFVALALAFLVGDVAAALAGTALGARLRGSRRSGRSGPDRPAA